MATEEQKQLATLIKGVHSSLRQSAAEVGADKAWQEHLKKTNVLESYAEAMRDLAQMWEANSEENPDVLSRIKWVTDYCNSYFFAQKVILEKRMKEIKTAEFLDAADSLEARFMEELEIVNILDVGSCYNPLSRVKHFKVVAVDLCPANELVYKGDFLQTEIAEDLEVSEKGELIKLPKNYFECVVFSLLLEYMPTSEQRIQCCEKAYDVLKHEGLLLIITPDSQHVGKNAKLMKNWRYTLAKMGFSRIRIDKFPYITCLAFRKCLSKTIAQHWADTHREDYMKFSIEIPQDRTIVEGEMQQPRDKQQ